MTGSTITIRTDDTLTQQITSLAAAMDRSRNWVIEEALRQYVAVQQWQIAGIEAAIKSLDKGEGIAHRDIMDAMENLLAAHTPHAD